MTTLFIGLDACDPATVHAMAARGELPTLAKLLKDGGRTTVRNPHGLFVGTLWESFATGLSPVHHGVHCWDEIDPETYEYRLIALPTERVEPFWVKASNAGKRVAVIDVPHQRADRPVDGVWVSEWGCHDRHFGLHSWPEKAASDLASAFGPHPIFGVDAWEAKEFAPDDYTHREGAHRTVEEEVEQFEGMLAGLDAKRKLSTSLLQEGAWDLFITVFGEGHATGHQQWHLHDPSHPRFSAATQAALGGDPLAAIYQRLDLAVADHIEAAGPDTEVFVLLSHGMGPHYDGTHVLDAVLRRIDLVDRGEMPWARGRRLLSRVPRRFEAAALPRVQRAAARRALPAEPHFVTADQRRGQRFYSEPNNYACGGVRFNLEGREGGGCVRKDDVPRLINSLRRDLLALVNVETGGPVVLSVEPVERWYPDRRATDNWPDLFIEWERSSLIETVWSPKVGLVHAPYVAWRTGDHLPDGELLTSGPGAATGSCPAAEMTDLARRLAPSG